MKWKIVFIDDDRDFVNDMGIILSEQCDFWYAPTIDEGLEVIRRQQPDVVFLDLMLGGGEIGLSGIPRIQKIDDTLPVIMITDYASIPTAVDAIRLGAADYISKTSNLQELKLIIQRSLEQKFMKTRVIALQEELQKPFDTIIGAGERAATLRNEISLIALHDATCLITGESGVGKELVARQIHKLSKRCDGPFIAVNCAAIPKELIESEFFGHERGSFTGADKRRIGKFELAKDGTIFLDEVSEMDERAQVKLLRVLQEKEFERVGGTAIIPATARVIAATNRNLEAMVQQGNFRYDLFYRLNVFPITVPPLRNRTEDLPLLIDHFLRQAAAETKTEVKTMSAETMAKFRQYGWPGNIRELHNVVIRSVILSNDREIIDESVIDLVLGSTSQSGSAAPTTWEEMDRMRKRASSDASRRVEKEYIRFVLKKFNGNISKAAEYSNINRTNFHKMMKKAGL
ncbi:MAG: sigma-54-dependent transcriptional regulator [Bacteroidota bacterium]